MLFGTLRGNRFGLGDYIPILLGHHFIYIMKLTEKNNGKKQTIKKKQIDKNKKEHVLIVAQEIKFARLLCSNEKKTRDRVLKTLKKWLLNCFQKGYEFKEDDFIRVWKGLFYAVWMSDKPLLQEELCESIAAILDQFPAEQSRHAILMTKAGLKVLATEWYGIDHHRMDKFLMLVRRYLRGSLRCLQRCGWSVDTCQMYTEMLSSADGLFALKTPHYARNALSMALHIIDCFLEEVAKVSDGEIPEESVAELLRPFCAYMAGGPAPALRAAARRLLAALARQSAAGLRYSLAARAWRQMGCPAGGPEALELVSDDDEDEQENEDHQSDDDEEMRGRRGRALDPRAGRVDVELSPVPVPAARLARLLGELLKASSSKAHKRVKICMQRFERLSRNEYPLAVTEDEWAGRVGRAGVGVGRAARALHALDAQLRGTADDLALRGLSRKHRKRLLAKTRSGISIVEEVGNMNESLSNSTNGNWQVESTEYETKKKKQRDGNKEVRNINIKLKDKQKAKKRKSEKDTSDVASKRPKIGAKDRKMNNKKGKKVINGPEISIVPNGHVKQDCGIDKTTENIDSNLLGDNITNKSPKQKGKKKENINSIFLEKNVSKSHPFGKVKEALKCEETKVLSGDVKVKNKVKDNEKVENIPYTNKKIKPTLLVSKVKNFQKLNIVHTDRKLPFDTPKIVKFVLKKNSMQGPVDYYKSVRQSPNIPFDSTKLPSKTNLKPSTPSPINPFFKKKLKTK